MPSTPPYSLEFRREAVRLLRTGGRSIPQLAKELGCSAQSLRDWARQLDVDDSKAPWLSSDEREELRRLRRENRILAEERDILKKPRPFSPTTAGLGDGVRVQPRRRASTPSRRCAGSSACRARAFTPGRSASPQRARARTPAWPRGSASCLRCGARSMGHRGSGRASSSTTASGSAASAWSG
jgi:transposase